jgi:hypothetical protein
MIKVYESDGSDGYSAGTYGVTITLVNSEGVESASGDGGFATRERAQKRGKALESNMRASWPGEVQ